jgi:hypothetical protein
MRAARFTRIDQQKMSRAVNIGDFHLIDRKNCTMRPSAS